MGKKYVSEDVYQAAKGRILFLLRRFDNVLIAFSGGKDSTVCLEMAYDIAKGNGLLGKLAFYHIDYEAQYSMTTDFVDSVFSSYGGIGRRYRICLPIKAQCACSASEPFWKPWEKGKEWVRPMPSEFAINESNCPIAYGGKTDYEFQSDFTRWFSSKYGTTAVVIGIRADESLNRYRAIMKDKSTFFGRRWTTKVDGMTADAYPIYDWEAEDDFTYFGKFSKPYNRLYDLYYQAGLKIGQMRVASPFNDCATSTLRLYKAIDPYTWAKMVGRVNGANFASIYGPTKAMGWKSITKPSGMSWKEYCFFLIGTLDEKSKRHYLEKLRTSVKFWKEKGGALDESTIDELNGAGEIGGKNNYSGKRTVRFEEYPDDLGVREFSKVPSYKRMCVCIMKNDWFCKYMGFSPTKEESERKKETMRRYRSL